ncbi:hypothetical protein C8C85_0385 [Flavobacterium sp. 103]|uniref:hypothetical protein n=1 Tax=Flavobacterium sp. 103 TaxID=2135624 RepID=UPI000D5EF168|nr:hypothetical protein [Flavobacterium sp. 103]PVX44640.1 hypothetical protein C8C85_0385 [Flavobacterium sp. 103]
MKEKVIIGLIFFILFSCKQNQEENNSTLKNEIPLQKKTIRSIGNYIHDIHPADSLCKANIQLAKSQIDSGKLYFTLQVGFGSYNTRQAKNLKKLCPKYGLHFSYEEITDFFKNEHDTPGCYGAYMDEAIEKKLGKNFRKKILREADQLSIANNDTIDAYECDIKPKIVNIEDGGIYLPSKNLKVKKNKYGQLINLDVKFYIDKNGNPSGYKLYKYMDDNLDDERERLFPLVLTELIKYKNCTPGKILGRNVTTENMVIINFQ